MGLEAPLVVVTEVPAFESSPTKGGGSQAEGPPWSVLYAGSLDTEATGATRRSTELGRLSL